MKREESIREKLMREPTMKLSKMQDIGGCRVILQNMKEVGGGPDFLDRKTALS